MHNSKKYNSLVSRFMTLTLIKRPLEVEERCPSAEAAMLRSYGNPAHSPRGVRPRFAEIGVIQSSTPILNTDRLK